LARTTSAASHVGSSGGREIEPFAPLIGSSRLSIAPHWLLSALLGKGGLLGTCCGARLRRFLPQNGNRAVLALDELSVAFRYLVDYFQG